MAEAKTTKNTADEIGLNTHIGSVLTSNYFYDEDPEIYKKWKNVGVLAIEMEAAALYINAAKTGKRALAMCSISDHIINHELLTADERQNSFTQMIDLALKTAVKL